MAVILISISLLRNASTMVSSCNFVRNNTHYFLFLKDHIERMDVYEVERDMFIGAYDATCCMSCDIVYQ